MQIPATEPTFGIYVIQLSDDRWHWCYGHQPEGWDFYVHVSRSGFSDPEAALAHGQRGKRRLAARSARLHRAKAESVWMFRSMPALPPRAICESAG